MTPLERAARALWEINGKPRKPHGIKPSMKFPEGEPDWEKFIPQARAVFEAIRNPSKAMCEQAFKIEDDFLIPTVGWQRGMTQAHHIWPAMIDAALEDG